MSLLELRDKNSLFNGRRKVSLYSDFRKLKERNPDGYEANMHAWESLLKTVIDSRKSNEFLLSLGNDFLRKLYDPEYGKPLALDIVIDSMVARRSIIPKAWYVACKHSIYASDGVLSWLMSKVIDKGWHSIAKDDGLVDEEYLVVEKLDEMAGKVWANLQADSYSQSLYTREMVYEFLESIIPDRKMVDFVLLYLSRDKPRLKISGDTIKCSMSNGEITEDDKKVAHLNETVQNLNIKILRLSDKIQKSLDQAKLALDKGNKQLAKYYLKAKSVTEKTQTDCMSKLENLEFILTKIDGASEDVRIVQAIEDGSVILKSIQKAIGGIDRVESLVEEFKDQALTADEISQQISETSGVTDVDIDDVEEELRAMEQQERDKLKQPFPDVPTTNPQASPTEDEVEKDLSQEMEKVALH